MADPSGRDMEPLLLDEAASLIKAIEVIDRGGLGIGLVVGPDRRLIGVITDRDTRRATLDRLPPEAKIAAYISYNPLVANAEMEDDDIFMMMRSSTKYQIPVVDNDGRVVGLRVISDFIDTVPLAVPSLQGNEWTYVKHCLDTNFVSSVGPYVEVFEKKVAEFLGVRRSVACVSGTSALHLALLGGGVTAGDEVLVPALTFIAPVNAISYCDARPVFLDSEWKTLGLSPASLEAFLEAHSVRRGGKLYNRTTGNRISAVVAVHIFGHPVDLDPIMRICESYDLPLIEDAAESLGSTYKGRNAGTFGLVGALSFNGNKIVTTGGGGMVVTDDVAIAQRVLHLGTQAKTDSIRYEHDQIGFNYRLSNVLAAIGVAQMERFSHHFARKRAIAEAYISSLQNMPDCHVFSEQPTVVSNYWLNTLIVPPAERERLLQHLISRNIMARPIWALNNRHRMYKNAQSGDLAIATEIYESALSLPSSVDLTDDKIDFICDTIRAYFRRK